MSKSINSTFTLKEILESTYHSKFKTRFEYSKRDVLKKIILIKETTLHPDQKSAPTVNYIFRSYSYPQYGKYLNYTKYSKQRKFRHQYDNVLVIAAEEDGSFSVNSKNWKYRLGSQKRWDPKPPQSKVKTIYRETQEKWKKDKFEQREKLIRQYSGDILKSKTKKLDEAYKKKKEDHKKSAKYLDTGDYNSQVNGINGDFYFRSQYCYQHYGHLYGRNTAPDADNDVDTPFATKHMISLIDALLKIGILKE